MNFTEGVEAALLDSNMPIATEYTFYILGRALFRRGSWAGEPLKWRPRNWDQHRARNAIGRLRERSSLAPDLDFRSGVWRIVHSSRAGSAEEIACIVDPFAYVSHLSAMQRYGLTDRSPEALHLSTPTRPVWNELRRRKVEEDLGDEPEGDRLPPLPRMSLGETIRRRPVVVHETSDPAVPVSVRGEPTRITSIGRTFVDMLAEPALCGGIRHVLDVWRREAADWVPEIVEEADRTGSKIVKVRAGYLLTELLGVEDTRVDAWTRFAQRGGSRKLDPDAPYAPTFSERWMLSLNA